MRRMRHARRQQSRIWRDVQTGHARSRQRHRILGHQNPKRLHLRRGGGGMHSCRPRRDLSLASWARQGSSAARYFPEPEAVLFFDGCFGSSLLMLKVCGVVAPVEVGMNWTFTFSVLPLDRLKVPLPLMTLN